MGIATICLNCGHTDNISLKRGVSLKGIICPKCKAQGKYHRKNDYDNNVASGLYTSTFPTLVRDSYAREQWRYLHGAKP